MNWFKDTSKMSKEEIGNYLDELEAELQSAENDTLFSYADLLMDEMDIAICEYEKRKL